MNERIEAPPPQDLPRSDKLFAEGKIMSLFEHLSELRYRLMVSAASILVLFCINIFFANDILLFLKKPLTAVLPNASQSLHFTGPLDVFLVGIKVAFLTAIVGASPIWMSQFWRFIAPALYQKERRFILPFIVASVLLFLLGVSFCFFIILPMTLQFLISMGQEVGTPMITITDYISLLIVCIFGFGAVFEAPLILVLLASLGVVSVEQLTASRRHVIVGILILAALLTPPDPLSQVGMSIPLYIMYELSIVIIRMMKRRKKS
jgi:sec-independent protein translocase protein TatC